MSASTNLKKFINCLLPVLLLLITTNVFAEDNSDKTEACIRNGNQVDTWLDSSHNYINTLLCKPVFWFDTFFADDRIYEEERAGTRIRWRNDLFFSETDDPAYLTQFNASFNLPNITRKLKIVFDGEEQNNLEGIVPANSDQTRSTLGAQFQFYKSLRSHISVRVKLTPIIILRYRYEIPITDSVLTRFTQEVYREVGNTGEITRIDFEKTFDENNLLRWSNQAEVTTDTEGTEWKESLVFFHRIDDKSALSYESSAVGVTQPLSYTTNTRLGVRYRRNFYRKWLFYELAPEVTWPREFTTDERQSVYGFTFRLEVFFDNL